MVSKIFETAFRIAFTTSEFTCPVASPHPRLHKDPSRNAAQANSGPEVHASGPPFLRHLSRDCLKRGVVANRIRGTHHRHDLAEKRLKVLKRLGTT